MSTPTVPTTVPYTGAGFSGLTAEQKAGIRSKAKTSRMQSLGASIPKQQETNIKAAYGRLSGEEKQKLLSALVIVAKNFVIGTNANLNDRTKTGGATDENYKKRNQTWNDNVTIVKSFITSATVNGVTPSWDSICLNLQGDLTMDIYGSFDNMYSPRFIAQTKLASYIPEEEFVLIYGLRTSAARLLGLCTGSFEGAKDDYKSIIDNRADITAKLKSLDLETCFCLANIIDYMARYRYYKPLRNADLRASMEKQAVDQLLDTAKCLNVTLVVSDTRRAARIKLGNALTAIKMKLIRTSVSSYAPVTKTKTLGEIGAGGSTPTGLDFITDITDMATKSKGITIGSVTPSVTIAPTPMPQPIVVPQIPTMVTIPTSIPVQPTVVTIPQTVTQVAAGEDNPLPFDDSVNEFQKPVILAVRDLYYIGRTIEEQQPLNGYRFNFRPSDLETPLPVTTGMTISGTNLKGAMRTFLTAVQTGKSAEPANAALGATLIKAGAVKGATNGKLGGIKFDQPSITNMLHSWVDVNAKEVGDNIVAKMAVVDLGMKEPLMRHPRTGAGSDKILVNHLAWRHLSGLWTTADTSEARKWSLISGTGIIPQMYFDLMDIDNARNFAVSH